MAYCVLMGIVMLIGLVVVGVTIVNVVEFARDLIVGIVQLFTMAMGH